MKNKAWFGTGCQNARIKYRLARKIQNQIPCNNNRKALKIASRNYKKKNTLINQFKKKMQTKLRSLKEFWKIINSIDQDNDEQNINLDTLYNFIKTLNKNNDHADDDNEINLQFIDDHDEISNSSITESEILKCIKSLKKKCPVNDNIFNEYLKHSQEKLIPVYVALFNLVLDTGIIPDPWLEGIIRPIYKRNGSPQNPENYRPITKLLRQTIYSYFKC